MTTITAPKTWQEELAEMISRVKPNTEGHQRLHDFISGYIAAMQDEHPVKETVSE